jgi:hypothetical protein
MDAPLRFGLIDAGYLGRALATEDSHASGEWTSVRYDT